jgi:hypothetical protein
LPRQLPESSLPATQVLSGHASAPASAFDLAGLARLLFFSAGVTRILQRVLFGAAPSAGALYPTELYAEVAAVLLSGVGASSHRMGCATVRLPAVWAAL